jgi:protein SCO1
MKKNKWLAFIIFDLIVILSLVSYFIFRLDGINIHGTYMKTPIALHEFHLINDSGKNLSIKDFKGQWTIVFFGFTSCPKVCPTTLVVLNDMYKKLQADLPESKLPQVVLISVDPERDTVKRLSHFVHSFNPAFTGARGNPEEIFALEKQMHLNASRENPLSHSMDVLLINPDARIQAYFAYPQQAHELAADYKVLINVKT